MSWSGARFRETYEAHQKQWYQILVARFPSAPMRRVYRMIDIARAIKARRGCLECGYNKAVEALDFDHRESVTKKFNISSPPLDCTIAEFKHEIRKCDVLCSNCHRIVTSKRRAEMNQRRAEVKRKLQAKADASAGRIWGDRAKSVVDGIRRHIDESEENKGMRDEAERLQNLIVNGMATPVDKARYFTLTGTLKK